MNTSLQKKRGKKSMKSTHDQRSPDLSLITLSTLLLWNRKHYSQITGRRVPDIDIFSLFNSEYSWLISVLLLVLQLGSSKCYVNGGSSWVEQHIMAKHFLRSHSLISLCSTVSPHVVSVLCIWSHWFYFPTEGSRLCLCKIVLLFH